MSHNYLLSKGWRAYLVRDENVAEIKFWCVDTFDVWTPFRTWQTNFSTAFNPTREYRPNYFYFKDIDLEMQFKLRWGHEIIPDDPI